MSPISRVMALFSSVIEQEDGVDCACNDTSTLKKKKKKFEGKSTNVSMKINR